MPARRLVILALVAATLAPAAAQTDRKGDRRAPLSPNPYTAFLPVGVTPDYEYWDAELARRATARMAQRTPMRLAAVVHDEAEAADARGANDTFETAELVGGFGTATDAVLTIRGAFAPGFDGPPTMVAPYPEEDGSTGDASDTGLSARQAILVQGATIGDGAFGATSGDFDYYAVTAATDGFVLRADIDTPTGTLDPTLTVIDAAGFPVAFNDDTDDTDSFIEVGLPEPGTYFVVVAGFGSSPGDVADPASGSGVGSTGLYDLLIAFVEPDVDTFAFDLRAGDVVGVGDGTASIVQVALFAPGGELQVGSRGDASGNYPANSPLPGGGASSAAAALVAPATGRYRVMVAGEGPYEVGVQGFRPVLEADPVLARQVLFVDFDGETIDADRLYGGAPNAALSPLSAFLAGWGFAASDEDALIDAILAVLQEKVADDLLAASNNPLTSVEILNSRDHTDPFGTPGVSRLIVGGTIAELGVGTIGIASSIDPGNFGLEDTAVILLDLLSLSDPADGLFANSLNQYAVDSGASKLGLVAQGVGNITAHEAGHFLGLFHTDQFNASPDIIDRGGNLPNSTGVGADHIFGTADDVNVDFGRDAFVEVEGFVGIQDGTNAVAFGLSGRSSVAVEDGPAADRLRASPNPVAIGAPLRVEGGAVGARATLFDALGRRAGEATADPSGAFAMATTGLAPGAYFVRVVGGEAARVVAVTVVR